MTISQIQVGNSTHDITLPGLNASVTELNYTAGVTSSIQNQLNKKMDDYSIELYNGTQGNPKPVRFASFNYSTCGSENGLAVLIKMVSGHGNGASYAFLQDAIIKVTHTGGVSVDNFKYYGAETDTYDGRKRQYGDIFWVVNETNKIVDFYCLMGQFARVYQTPWKRLTYSTGGTVTQYTGATIYSSGTKIWANNSNIALESKFDNYYNKTEIDNTVAEINNTKADKATTLKGYGILDAYTSGTVDSLLNNKADKATTLAGYNIGDAYTKTEVDTKKADKATTLAGYGITNAYTKTEVNDIVDDYLPLTGGTLSGNLAVSGHGLYVQGRYHGAGDDEGIIIAPAGNGFAGLTLGSANGKRSVFYLKSDGAAVWRYNNGESAQSEIMHPGEAGTIALQSHVDKAKDEAKAYANTVKSDILGGAEAAYDTLLKLKTALDAGDVDTQTLLTALFENYVTIGTSQTVTGQKTFQGETKMLHPTYAPTMNDIASGVGCSLKNSRACDNQLIAAEIFAPYTTKSDEVLNMTSTPGELPFYSISGVSEGKITGKTLLGKINASGWNGNVVGNVSGSATSLTTSAGSTTQPIYFKDGKPAACGNSLAVSVTGNAGSADKLKTSRTISLTGDVTGSVGFDGSGNVSMTTTVTNDSHSHSNYLPLSGGTMSGTIDFSDRATWVTPYLLAFKDAEPSNSATYPYTGFYQWGNEWQVNARDASNTFKHNVFSINLDSKVARFEAVPNVAGVNVALTNQIPTTLKNPYSLTIQGNGIDLGTYDGSAAKTINLSAEHFNAYTKSETYSKTEIGNLLDAQTHSAEDITSGVLPLTYGGTGAALTATANAIIRYSSSGQKLSATTTKSGAFYATAANGAPQFGTLPIAQGGTGATSADAARANIGAAASNHNHDEVYAPASHNHDYLPLTGGTLGGTLNVSNGGKINQGTTSDDTTVSSMNRFQSDLYIQGDGSAPNAPRVAGFYLGKSTVDDNRHMDIVSGGKYSYIDFNQAGAEVDYNVRILADVETGYTQFMWGGSGTNQTLDIMGTLKQNSQNVATQAWVEGKGYLTSAALNDYATQSWVNNKGYITSSALSGYATQKWVEGKGYITSSALSGYATTSAVNSALDTKVNKAGDTMTGKLQFNMSNPHLHMKDTAYDTNWYFQAYQDTLAFGPTYADAVKTDKSGNMWTPGTIQGKYFKTDATAASIKPSDSNEINFGSNANYIYIGYENRVGSEGAVDTYKFGCHSGAANATNGKIECGQLTAGGAVKGNTVTVANAVTMQYNTTNECLNFVFA